MREGESRSPQRSEKREEKEGSPYMFCAVAMTVISQYFRNKEDLIVIDFIPA